MLDRCPKVYKWLGKKTKDYLNQCGDVGISCLWVRKMSIVKMSILLKIIYRFITIEIENWFIHRNHQAGSKLMWKGRKIRII